MSIKIIFEPCDMWVGAFWDTRKKCLFLMFFMIGIRLSFKMKRPTHLQMMLFYFEKLEQEGLSDFGMDLSPYPPAPAGLEDMAEEMQKDGLASGWRLSPRMIVALHQEFEDAFKNSVPFEEDL